MIEKPNGCLPTNTCLLERIEPENSDAPQMSCRHFVQRSKGIWWVCFYHTWKECGQCTNSDAIKEASDD